MTRAAWIDACRFLAIFVIMVTHFLDKLLPSALLLWEAAPGRWLLGGLTGKFSVAFFFVLLGYFASAPAEPRLRGFIDYTLRRYVQFAFFVFLTTLVYLAGSYAVTWLFHAPDDSVLRVISDGFRYNLIYLLHDAFLFEDRYNATLWCMQQLFLASLLCRGLGYLPERLSGVLRLSVGLLVILLLLLTDASYCIWIAAAVLGFVLRLALERPGLGRLLEKPALRLPVFLLAVACIKAPLPESVLLYALEGLGALLLLLCLFHTAWARRLLSAAPLPWLGGVSMGLFVVHTPINSLLYSSYYALVRDRLPAAAALPLYFVLSFFLCVLCARLLHRGYAAFVRAVTRETLPTR